MSDGVVGQEGKRLLRAVLPANMLRDPAKSATHTDEREMVMDFTGFHSWTNDEIDQADDADPQLWAMHVDIDELATKVACREMGRAGSVS